jgi:hypothetical protein
VNGHIRTYATPAAFKRALEERLRQEAQKTGTPVVRLRQLLVFDRLLGRMEQAFGSSVIAKGGVALELRLERARTTRDLDLRMAAPVDGLVDRLRDAARQSLGDFLTYEIRENTGDGAAIDGDGAVYEGIRFRAEARLAGALYGMPFGLDVAFGDVLTGKVDEIEGSPLLDFVGAPRSRIRLYPRETHVAEKLHAYTLPRARENSRVKDLPDIALLARSERFEGQNLRAALERTFGFRGTHPLPRELPPPPTSWAAPYARMAAENELPWSSLAAVHEAARAFLEPVLQSAGGTWNPAPWSWTSDART